LALSPNIKLTFKDLPATTALAYYEDAKITDIKYLQHWVWNVTELLVRDKHRATGLGPII